MKNNPLFFDSTKFRGDNVIVDIELQGVELSLGESLEVRVIMSDGSDSYFLMSARGLRKWHAEARVEYQQRIKLEFIVKKNEEIITKSDIRTTIASYSVYQKWERMPPILKAVQEELESDFDENLINGPTLVENENGVFEPMKPATAAIPEKRHLPMIIEINNPKTAMDKAPFTNENFVTPKINSDLE